MLTEVQTDVEVEIVMYVQGPPYVFATTVLVQYISLVVQILISFLIPIADYSGFQMVYHLIQISNEKVVKRFKK